METLSSHWRCTLLPPPLLLCWAPTHKVRGQQKSSFGPSRNPLVSRVPTATQWLCVWHSGEPTTGNIFPWQASFHTHLSTRLGCVVSSGKTYSSEPNWIIQPSAARKSHAAFPNQVEISFKLFVGCYYPCHSFLLLGHIRENWLQSANGLARHLLAWGCPFMSRSKPAAHPSHCNQLRSFR